MGFWVEDLVARCYKNYVTRKILDRIGITLRNLKTYEYISRRLKAIKYKDGFSCYLSVLLRPSH